MHFKRIFVLLFLILFKWSLSPGQVIPSPNSFVNSSSVYLQEFIRQGAETYELSFFSDSLKNTKAPLKIKQSNNLPAFYISNLEWRQSYFWNVSAYDKEHKQVYKSSLYTFSLVPVVCNFLNAEVKLELKINSKTRHAGGLVLVDYARSAFDRNGTIVWTLPNIPGLVDSITQIRDLKLSSDNTITFLTPQNAVEIDLDAAVLWKAPNPFLFENEPIIYHHDLKKTPRGTYMVLGKRKVSRRLTGEYTSKELEKEYESYTLEGKNFKKTFIDVLLEFDKDGKLLWFWDANDYITDEDLAYKKDPGDGTHPFTSHSNAFSENEDGSSVYMGFRDLSRIIKIDKKTKKVLMSYGEKFPSGDGKAVNDLFRKQHDATITRQGSLLILNNNEPSDSKVRRVSNILEFDEDPKPGKDPVNFTFALDYDGSADAWSSGGGNVTELPNGNILVCGGIFNRLIEVTKQKQVVWDAAVMYRFKKDKSWSPFPQYRASWLPALNRYYFIPYLNSSSAKNEISLSIANTGTADDTYILEIFDKNKSLQKIATKSISPGSTSVQLIKLKKVPSDSKELLIKIRSEKGKVIKELSLTL